MNMWLTDASDGGCGGGLDFAPVHTIYSVGQCDVNIPNLLPHGSRSKAVANYYRHEYQHGGEIMMSSIHNNVFEKNLLLFLNLTHFHT